MKTRIGREYKLAQLEVGDLFRLGPGDLLIVSDYLLEDKSGRKLFVNVNTGEAMADPNTHESNAMKFMVLDKPGKQNNTSS